MAKIRAALADPNDPHTVSPFVLAHFEAQLEARDIDSDSLEQQRNRKKAEYTDRQADRQTDRQVDRQTDRQTVCQTDSHSEHPDRQTVRLSDLSDLSDRQTGRNVETIQHQERSGSDQTGCRFLSNTCGEGDGQTIHAAQ